MVTGMEGRTQTLPSVTEAAVAGRQRLGAFEQQGSWAPGVETVIAHSTCHSSSQKELETVISHSSPQEGVDIVGCGSPTDTLSPVGSPASTGASSSSSCRLALSPPLRTDVTHSTSATGGVRPTVHTSRRVCQGLITSEHQVASGSASGSRSEDDDGYCSRSSLDSPVQISVASHSGNLVESNSDSDSEICVRVVEIGNSGGDGKRKDSISVMENSESIVVDLDSKVAKTVSINGHNSRVGSMNVSSGMLDVSADGTMSDINSCHSSRVDLGSTENFVTDGDGMQGLQKNRISTEVVNGMKSNDGSQLVNIDIVGGLTPINGNHIVSFDSAIDTCKNNDRTLSNTVEYSPSNDQSVMALVGHSCRDSSGIKAEDSETSIYLTVAALASSQLDGHSSDVVVLDESVTPVSEVEQYVVCENESAVQEMQINASCQVIQSKVLPSLENVSKTQSSEIVESLESKSSDSAAASVIIGNQSQHTVASTSVFSAGTKPSTNVSQVVISSGQFAVSSSHQNSSGAKPLTTTSLIVSKSSPTLAKENLSTVAQSVVKSTASSSEISSSMAHATGKNSGTNVSKNSRQLHAVSGGNSAAGRNITVFILPQGSGTSDTLSGRSGLKNLAMKAPIESLVNMPAGRKLSGVVNEKSLLQNPVLQASSSSSNVISKPTLNRSSSTTQLHSSLQKETTNGSIARRTNGPDWLTRETLLHNSKTSTSSFQSENAGRGDGVVTASAQIGRLGSLSLRNESESVPGNSATGNSHLRISDLGNPVAEKCTTYQISAQQVARLTSGISGAKIKAAALVQGESAKNLQCAGLEFQQQRRTRRAAVDPSVTLHPLIDHDYCEFTVFSADIQSSIITTTESSARTERRYVKKSRSSGNLRPGKSLSCTSLLGGNHSNAEVNEVVAAVTDRVRQAYNQATERSTGVAFGAARTLGKPTKVPPSNMVSVTTNSSPSRLTNERVVESLRNKKRKYKKNLKSGRDYRPPSVSIGTSAISKNVGVSSAKSKSKVMAGSKRSAESGEAVDDGRNYVKIPGHYQDEFVYYTSTKRLASSARLRKRERGGARDSSSSDPNPTLQDEYSTQGGSSSSELRRVGGKASVGGISVFDWYREMAQTDKSSRFGATDAIPQACTPMDESDVADLVMDMLPRSEEYTSNCLGFPSSVSTSLISETPCQSSNQYTGKSSDYMGLDTSESSSSIVGVGSDVAGGGALREAETKRSAIVESFLSVTSFVGAGGSGEGSGGTEVEDVSHADLSVMAEEVCQMLNSMNEADLKMLESELSFPDQPVTLDTTLATITMATSSPSVTVTPAVTTSGLMDVDEINDTDLLSVNITNMSGILRDLSTPTSCTQGEGRPRRFSMCSVDGGSSGNNSANLSELFDADIYLSVSEGAGSTAEGLRVDGKIGGGVLSTAGATLSSSTGLHQITPHPTAIRPSTLTKNPMSVGNLSAFAQSGGNVTNISTSGAISVNSGGISATASNSSVPELTTVNMFWNDLPGLMLGGREHVRLVDIHKQIMPAKDTGILKKRCLMMALRTTNCTELQRDFLIRYMNAAKSKSTVMIDKSGAERLIGFYVNPKAVKGDDVKSVDGASNIGFYVDETDELTSASSIHQTGLVRPVTAQSSAIGGTEISGSLNKSRSLPGLSNSNRFAVGEMRNFSSQSITSTQVTGSNLASDRNSLPSNTTSNRPNSSANATLVYVGARPTDNTNHFTTTDSTTTLRHATSSCASPVISASDVKRSARLRNKHISYADMVHGVFEKSSNHSPSDDVSETHNHSVAAKGQPGRRLSSDIMGGDGFDLRSNSSAGSNKMVQRNIAGLSCSRRPEISGSKQNVITFGRKPFRGMSRLQIRKNERAQSRRDDSLARGLMHELNNRNSSIGTVSPHSTNGGSQAATAGGAMPVSGALPTISTAEPVKWRRIHRLVRPDIPAVMRPPKIPRSPKKTIALTPVENGLGNHESSNLNVAFSTTNAAVQLGSGTCATISVANKEENTTDTSYGSHTTSSYSKNIADNTLLTSMPTALNLSFSSSDDGISVQTSAQTLSTEICNSNVDASQVNDAALKQCETLALSGGSNAFQQKESCGLLQVSSLSEDNKNVNSHAIDERFVEGLEPTTLADNTEAIVLANWANENNSVLPGIDTSVRHSPRKTVQRVTLSPLRRRKGSDKSQSDENDVSSSDHSLTKYGDSEIKSCNGIDESVEHLNLSGEIGNGITSEDKHTSNRRETRAHSHVDVIVPVQKVDSAGKSQHHFVEKFQNHVDSPQPHFAEKFQNQILISGRITRGNSHKDSVSSPTERNAPVEFSSCSDRENEVTNPIKSKRPRLSEGSDLVVPEGLATPFFPEKKFVGTPTESDRNLRQKDLGRRDHLRSIANHHERRGRGRPIAKKMGLRVSDKSKGKTEEILVKRDLRSLSPHAVVETKMSEAHTRQASERNKDLTTRHGVMVRRSLPADKSDDARVTRAGSNRLRRASEYC